MTPFVVGVAELLRHPGTQKVVQVAGELPGLALSSARVPDGAEIGADLVLEAQFQTLTATGTVRVPWDGACRRCLRPVAGVATTEVREVFERHPVEGETYRLDADRVDLRPMVRDAALLALPLAPLCRDDCPGPDPGDYPVAVADAGANGGEPATGEGADPSPDPRWAALDQLRFDR